jgi:hypothetical protein
MALYDAKIQRSFTPPDSRYSYWWEVVVEPSDPPMVLAGWVATPLDAVAAIGDAIRAADPQRPAAADGHQHQT